MNDLKKTKPMKPIQHTWRVLAFLILLPFPISFTQAQTVWPKEPIMTNAKITSTEWEEFESTDENVGMILNGIGNTDIYKSTLDGKPFEGLTLRLFNPKTRLWSLYWVPSNTGVMDPPVVGSFEGNIGKFYGKDVFQGKPILVVFVWDKTDKDNPVWSQAFSPDNGKTWEWNFTNVSHRIK